MNAQTDHTLPTDRPDIEPPFRVYADRLGYAFCEPCAREGSGSRPLQVFDAQSGPWNEDHCDCCGRLFLD